MIQAELGFIPMITGNQQPCLSCGTPAMERDWEQRLYGHWKFDETGSTVVASDASAITGMEQSAAEAGLVEDLKAQSS
jgi:hypothetical protein